MKFAILVFENDDDFAARTDARGEAYMGAYMSYARMLEEAGIMTGGAGLMPPDTATTLRLAGERRHVEDGPHAEAKEQLGGFFLIDVPDLDAALEWASKCPSASRAGVEVRPLMAPPEA